MQTKTYFASSVPAALEVARKELGDEALLVNSRPSPVDVRPYGRLEVTFAFERGGKSPVGIPAISPPVGRRPPAVAPASGARAVTGVGNGELEEIRRQLSALRSAVGRTSGSGGDRLIDERLVNAGLDPDLAREIALAVARRPADRSGDGTGAWTEELASRIPVAPFQPIKAGECRTLAFIGPPGRGKTTSLVKIAVREGLAHRIPVRIYSAGAHGVGCQEQMARYATLIGVPYQSCESLESLHIAMNDGWTGLALIDTPGISPADRTDLSDFDRFFSARPEIERHLVLRADAQTADMLHVLERYSMLKPTRLLITGTDEAVGLGSMVNTLLRSRIPAVFAGTGSQIPDDIEEVDALKLARSLCGERALAAVAA